MGQSQSGREGSAKQRDGIPECIFHSSFPNLEEVEKGTPNKQTTTKNENRNAGCGKGTCPFVLSVKKGLHFTKQPLV